MIHNAGLLIHAVVSLTVLSSGIISQPSVSALAREGGADTAKEAKPDAVVQEGGEEEKTPRIFRFDMGFSGSFAKGVSDKSLYYQPFVNFYLNHRYVSFTGGVSRFWNYQITNGEGEVEKVNFTEPRVALSVYPHRVLEISGDYRYSSGDKSHYYRAHYIGTGLALDFEVVALKCSASFKKTEYHFKSDDLYGKLEAIDKAIVAINNYPAPPSPPTRDIIIILYNKSLYNFKNLEQMRDIMAAPTFSWYFHKTTSLDLGYDHAEKYFFPYNHDKDNAWWWNAKYYSNSGRIGIYSDPSDYVSIKAGVSAGVDSERYIIVTPDLGLIFNILDYVKISGTYSPGYYKAPPPSLGTKIGPFHPFRVSKNFLKVYEIAALVTLVRRKNANPYMNLQNIAKSFWNQEVSYGVTFTY